MCSRALSATLPSLPTGCQLQEGTAAPGLAPGLSLPCCGKGRPPGGWEGRPAHLAPASLGRGVGPCWVPIHAPTRWRHRPQGRAEPLPGAAGCRVPVDPWARSIQAGPDPTTKELFLLRPLVHPPGVESCGRGRGHWTLKAQQGQLHIRSHSKPRFLLSNWSWQGLQKDSRAFLFGIFPFSLTDGGKLRYGLNSDVNLIWKSVIVFRLEQINNPHLLMPLRKGFSPLQHGVLIIPGSLG